MSSQHVVLSADEIAEIASMDDRSVRRLPREVVMAYIRHVQGLIDAFVAARLVDPTLCCPQLEALMPAMDAMTTDSYCPDLSPTSGESMGS